MLKYSTFLLLDSWVQAESGLTLASVGLADSDSDSDSGPVDSDSDSDSGPMDSDSHLMDSDSGLVDSDSLPDSWVRTHSNTGLKCVVNVQQTKSWQISKEFFILRVHEKVFHLFESFFLFG